MANKEWNNFLIPRFKLHQSLKKKISWLKHALELDTFLRRPHVRQILRDFRRFIFFNPFECLNTESGLTDFIFFVILNKNLIIPFFWYRECKYEQDLEFSATSRQLNFRKAKDAKLKKLKRIRKLKKIRSDKLKRLQASRVKQIC